MLSISFVITGVLPIKPKVMVEDSDWVFWLVVGAGGSVCIPEETVGGSTQEAESSSREKWIW
jgi:hypothetical protein